MPGVTEHGKNSFNYFSMHDTVGVMILMSKDLTFLGAYLGGTVHVCDAKNSKKRKVILTHQNTSEQPKLRDNI